MCITGTKRHRLTELFANGHAKRYFYEYLLGYADGA